jgi:hypothetical protein
VQPWCELDRAEVPIRALETLVQARKASLREAQGMGGMVLVYAGEWCSC